MCYEEALVLFKKNCHYCQAPPSNKLKFENKVIGRYQGIDRVDNSLGYLTTNIVPCCKHCNSFKSDRTYDDFIRHVRKLYKQVVESDSTPY